MRRRTNQFAVIRPTALKEEPWAFRQKEETDKLNERWYRRKCKHEPPADILRIDVRKTRCKIRCK